MKKIIFIFSLIISIKSLGTVEKAQRVLFPPAITDISTSLSKPARLLRDVEATLQKTQYSPSILQKAQSYFFKPAIKKFTTHDIAELDILIKEWNDALKSIEDLNGILKLVKTHNNSHLEHEEENDYIKDLCISELKHRHRLNSIKTKYIQNQANSLRMSIIQQNKENFEQVDQQLLENRNKWVKNLRKCNEIDQQHNFNRTLFLQKEKWDKLLNNHHNAIGAALIGSGILAIVKIYQTAAQKVAHYCETALFKAAVKAGQIGAEFYTK